MAGGPERAVRVVRAVCDWAACGLIQREASCCQGDLTTILAPSIPGITRFPPSFSVSRYRLESFKMVGTILN